jgi:predicted thioesterase
MIGLMEGAAVNAIEPHLPEGMSSVGVDLKVRHMAATPVGLAIRAIAELTEIDGMRLAFSVKAFDEKEQIGSGTHERYGSRFRDLGGHQPRMKSIPLVLSAAPPLAAPPERP